jgi:hypothetical protein
MAYQQYRQGATFYGYDPDTQQGIAFSNPQEFNKYFPSFNNNAPTPTFDVSKLMAAPNQVISLAPPPQQSTPQAVPQQAMPQAPQASMQAPTYTPMAYTPPNVDTSNLKMLEQQYQILLSPTAEETQTQQQLDNLIASRDLGLNKIENQPIPLDLNIGQSNMLIKQAATQAMPLQQRLALAQAKRQAALDASKFALEREDQRIADLKNEARYKFELESEQARNSYNAQLQTYQQQISQQQKQQDLLLNQRNVANDYSKQFGISARFFKYPGNPTVYDAQTLEPLSYEEYKKRGGAGVLGQPFPDVQEIASSNQSKLLSVTEAARLGVPYGTTQEEAAALSRTPSFGKASSGRSTSSNKGSSSSSSFSGNASRGRVEDYIKLVINESGGVNDQNRYELWGYVADELKAAGVNPTSFDDILWKYFHPEGTKGYSEYKLGR